MAVKGILVRSVRLAVAASIVAILSTSLAAPARATVANTFFGTGAGTRASSNISDSGFGIDVLSGGDSGGLNTAIGADALSRDTRGFGNTASGVDALFANTTGNANTASGYEALADNTTGFENTASGVDALQNNTEGNNNMASGYQALIFNTTGNDNTASGSTALYDNTTGHDNTASGVDALERNTIGDDNTGSGFAALQMNTTGSNNTAVGYQSGDNLTTGSNNIDIGNQGVAGESNTIRIGTHGTQTKTFIAGITSVSFSGLSVVVNSTTGQLGFLPSAARYKRDIRPMGEASRGLMKLRPVSFHYKDDPDGARQYGLIAEEVARVYPELVVYSDDGKLVGVRYDLLPAMLLNELKRKDAQIAAQQLQLDALVGRMSALERQVRAATPARLASVDQWIKARQIGVK